MSLPVSEHSEQTHSAPFTHLCGNFAAQRCDTAIGALGVLSRDRFETRCTTSLHSEDRAAFDGGKKYS